MLDSTSFKFLKVDEFSFILLKITIPMVESAKPLSIKIN